MIKPSSLSYFIVNLVLILVFILFCTIYWSFFSGEPSQTVLIKKSILVLLSPCFIFLAARLNDRIQLTPQATTLLLIISLFLTLSLGLSKITMKSFFSPVTLDQGAETIQAASILTSFVSPYSVDYSTTFIKEKYHGYKYGPVLAASYIPALLIQPHGSKLLSALFLVSSTLLLILVSSDLKSALFASIIATAPSLIWTELFIQGTVDIVSIFFICLSILSLKREHIVLSGFFIMMSLLCKPLPALFVMILIYRILPSSKKQFVLGSSIGFLFALPFLLIDGLHFYQNFIEFHLIKGFGKNSLYAITPEYIHNGLSLVPHLLLVVLLFLPIRFLKTFGIMTISSVSCAIFLGLGKQLHHNHLVWLIWIIALAVALAPVRQKEVLHTGALL